MPIDDAESDASAESLEWVRHIVDWLAQLGSIQRQQRFGAVTGGALEHHTRKSRGATLHTPDPNATSSTIVRIILAACSDRPPSGNRHSSAR